MNFISIDELKKLLIEKETVLNEKFKAKFYIKINGTVKIAQVVSVADYSMIVDHAISKADNRTIIVNVHPVNAAGEEEAPDIFVIDLPEIKKESKEFSVSSSDEVNPYKMLVEIQRDFMSQLIEMKKEAEDRLDKRLLMLIKETKPRQVQQEEKGGMDLSALGDILNHPLAQSILNQLNQGKGNATQ